MRKILATLALLLGAFQILLAIPAYPGWIRVTQPDGSVVTVRIHGDEYLHYVTNQLGQVVAQDADGFYRPAAMPTAAEQEEAVQMRRQARQLQQQAAKASRGLTTGTVRIPVVLVNFSDKEFITPNPATAFSNLLNQEGYAENGATGSVHDFYYENSRGSYDPVFEVFGPVTLPETSEHYAYNQTGRASQALFDACTLLDGEVDFSQYDSDGNGAVDVIVMYYAGYNQAEGGGSTTIWPHQGYGYGTFDETRLSLYFCTSELRGNAGGRMCGIGTSCHEFGHTLGLPDFYDTDYEQNGSAGGLYSFSTMCSGSYNNNGRTPPYLNSEERKMLGWMEDQTEIPSVDELQVLPVQEGVAYRTATTMDGEYFVYECRNKTGWDSYLPSGGLLVYHVDKSARESLKPSDYWASYYTPERLWSDWSSTDAINAFGSHPCFYLVPSASPQSLNYTGRETDIPFPGRQNVTEYTPVDWQGESGDFRFSRITYDGSRVTMTVRLMAVAGVEGKVRNTAAKPIRGATVSIYPAASAPAAAPGRRQARRRVAGTPLMTTTTEADGAYSLEGESLVDGTFTLVVTCDGYVQAETEVSIGRRIVTRDFYLRKVGEPEETTFIKYDPEGETYYGFGYGDSSYDLSAGIHLTVEETAAYAGKQIKLISFQPYGDESTTAQAAYVFIESGGKRVFTQRVDEVRFDAMNTVNVVSHEFLIPGDAELYIGYGLVGCSEDYPLLVQPCAEENAGYLADFNQTRPNSWTLMMDGDGAFYTPVLSASVGERADPELGFNHIANPGNGTYAAGDRFALDLVRYAEDTPSSVSWTFDGQTVQADAVTLTAGAHTVEAHLTYPDGAVEVIRLVINAE